MPTTLNPTGSYGPDSINVPADGEPRSAASVRTPFQDLLNKVDVVKSIIFGGVPKIRSVDSIALLKAVTGQATGDQIVVKELGLYQFDQASAATSNDITVVTPNVGGGRWLHTNRAAIGAALGFAPLDASSKVPAANLRGQRIVSGSLEIPAQDGVATGTPAAIGPSVSVTLTPGQLWLIFVTMTLTRFDGDAGSFLAAQVRVTQPDNAKVTPSGGRVNGTVANGVITAGCAASFLATQSGIHAAQVSLGVGGSGTITYTMTGQFDHHTFGGTA